MKHTHTPGPWERDEDGWVCAKDQTVIWAEFDHNSQIAYVAMREQDEPLILVAPGLLAALEPFAWLARVMEPDQILNYRGVYITWEQAQAAADAVAVARGEMTHE